jgi:hypothetical protein
MNKLMTGTLALILGLAATGNTAKASPILQSYFDLTTYGTQAGGAVITDQSGNNVTATLRTDANTSLTASGLGITGGNCNNTGLMIGSSDMSVFTGAFSIQTWTTLAAVNNNQVLFGANNGNINGYIGDGGTVSSIFGAVRGDAISGFVGGHTPSYSRYGYGIADGSFTAATATLYDVVYTWDGTDFKEYVNGTLMGTRNMPTFGSLAQASSAGSSSGNSGFVIGGGMNQPYNDAANPQTTSSFLMFTGALDSTQVSNLHNLGAGASTSSIVAAIPEPATLGLIGTFGVGLLFIRRRLMM